MRTNWSGNYTYRAAGLVQPSSLAEVQDVMRTTDHVRALGTGHTFTSIADTVGVQVSLARMPGEPSIDEGAGTVSVPAHWRYGELGRWLHERGWALANLASLPHISVAGAVATATHGSGAGNQNLAAAVVALELVTANGDVRTLTRRDPHFAAAVVGMGAVGIVTRLELTIEPTYAVTQWVYENLPWDAVGADFDAIMGSAYSVSLFTDWLGQGAQLAYVKEREGAPHDAELLQRVSGGRASGPRHPLPGGPTENVTEQGTAGPWHERLPHFRLEFTPSGGEEIQSEYLVDARHAVEAIDALRAIGPQFSPLLYVSEIRTIAADDLWMSTAYDRDSVAFHFTWHRDQPAVEAVLPAIEAALAPFGARPHWGKLFLLGAAEIAELYPRFHEFRGLVEEWDPRGRLRNAFLDEHVLGPLG